MSASTLRLRTIQGRTFGLIAAIALATFSLGGCASSGAVNDLNTRLDTIDQRLADMAGQLDDTVALAASAENAATAAQAQAEAAANSAADADAAARRATAAFDKTVRK